jgi:hypothetical protein
MLKLRVLGDEKKDVWLVDPGLVIGSAAGVGLHLSAAGVKDKHAQVIVNGDSVSLKNLCADTQLLINGKAAGAEKPLKIGDEISLAGVRLLVVDPKEGFVAKQPAAESSTSPWSIRANHSALNNRVYPIAGKMVLGRSNECDITLSVTHLSRKHAELSVVGNKLLVKDLDSANGTFVNGKRIKEETLRKGDELRLDTLSFSVIGPADEMDKTSVRTAISPSSMAAAEKPHTPAPVVKSSKPAPAAPRATAPAPKIEVTAAAPEAASGNTNLLVVGAVAAVIVVAAIVYFIL